MVTLSFPFAREEFVADGCADMSRSAYSLMESAPQCFDMLDALLETAGLINPCESRCAV